MRTTIITFISLLALSLHVNAQDFLMNEEVDSLWRTQTISVKNGGQSPSVVTLLRAFNASYPTWVGNFVLKQNDHPSEGTKRNGKALVLDTDDEGGFSIRIDPSNGYACLSSYTDIDQMSCCVWRRTNGHRLFAISLYQQHDRVQHLLCWFDYDPKTQTMKPERSPLDDFKKKDGIDVISWNLPDKGTDFQIVEYYVNTPTITYVYKWDGMQHKLAKSQIEDFQYQQFGEGDWHRASQQGFTEYALTSIVPHERPMLWLRKPKTSNEATDNFFIFYEYRGDMQTVAINDEQHHMGKIWRVKPEEGSPWTAQNVLVHTKDAQQNNYYTVFKDDYVLYYVINSPSSEDGKSYQARSIGFGGKSESVRIINAEVAEELTFQPDWQKFEFVKGDE